MNKENALSFVYDCLSGDNSFAVKLRMKEGLDEKRFNQLKEALHFLIDCYSNEDIVPKRLALCMVDIYAAFSFREGFYGNDDTIKIENAGIELQDLATELFS